MSTLSPFDASRFVKQNTCLPCCEAGCDLTMPTILIDGSTTNYTDLTTATAAIAAQAATGCIVEGRNPGSDTRTAFSGTFTSGTLAVESDYTYSFFGDDTLVFRCSLTSADGIVIGYTTTATGGFGVTLGMFVYADDQTTLIDSTSVGAPGTGSWTPTISANGFYYIYVHIGAPGMTASTISLSCTGGTTFLPCKIRAAYDDGSGGTSYVACI